MCGTASPDLNTGTYIFAEHSRLTRSVAFPSEILVFGAAGSRLLEFLAEIVLILILLAVFTIHRLPPSFALLPVLMLLQMLLIGLALPIATLSVFCFNVQHALPIALTTLFYLSPVFYPVGMVPEAFRPFYFLHPSPGCSPCTTRFSTKAGCRRLALLLGVTARRPPGLPIGYAIFKRYASVYAEISDLAGSRRRASGGLEAVYYYEHRTKTLREWFIRRVLHRPLNVGRAQFTLRRNSISGWSAAKR